MSPDELVVGETPAPIIVPTSLSGDFVDSTTILPHGIYTNHFLMNGTTYAMNLTHENQSTFSGNDLLKKDFIFDRTDVRVIFITLYSLVFSGCFFGKLSVFFVHFEWSFCVISQLTSIERLDT